MQLIEVTGFGVRSAVIWMTRRQTPLRFVLFPMVHLGTAAFYGEVTRRLKSCELIIAEGVSGRSIAVSALTAAYRIPGRRKRFGLMSQRIDFSAIGVAVINPDATATQFEAGWRRLPIFFRLAVLALAPILGIWIALVGFRATFAKLLETNDLPTREQLLRSGRLAEMEDVLVRDRDALLLKCIDQIHEKRSSERIDVGIVYGAGHMPAVVHHLSDRYGYFARDADWMTVLPF